jgi:SAM-dependent methyltransferase
MKALKYKPSSHLQNRMKHEGDVARARNYYLNEASPNLKFLLKNRFSWMNNFIEEGDVGIEVGCGTGLSKLFIKNKHYRITDYANNEWLDDKMVDALNTPYANGSLDFVVSSNMIHHVPYPAQFFKEMHRILRPGGRVIIQEINASLCMRLALRIMRHEGYDFTINVYDENTVCTDPNDLWSANCAIPNLLFDDEKKFVENFPYFLIEKKSFSEFFMFLNSGGVIAKTKYIPLSTFLLKMVQKLDNLLIALSQQTFAMQRQIVLRKIAQPEA